MSASGLMLERPHAVAPQRVLLLYPQRTSVEMVSVNRWASAYQVAFIPVLQKLNGDALAKLEEGCLKGGQGLT